MLIMKEATLHENRQRLCQPCGCPLAPLISPRTLFLVYSYLESVLFQIKVFYPQIKHPPLPREIESTPLFPPLRGGPFTSYLTAEKETLCGRLHFVMVVFVMYTLPQYACYSSTWVCTCCGNSCTCSHFPVSCCSGRLSRQLVILIEQ